MSRKQKILIVEDDLTMLQTIKDILSGLDARLDGAESGEKALKLIEKSSFDVIVLDLTLPGIDGFETLRRATKIRRDLGPVVVLTAAADSQTGFTAGRMDYVFEYLTKDQLGAKMLKETVVRALNPDFNSPNARVKPCFRHNKLGCFENAPVRRNLVFVGMPFSQMDIYEHGIKPVVETLGLVCWRADEDFKTGDIACKLSETIQSCRIAVMEISEFNPNVYFELGLAYGYGVQVVLLRRADAPPVPTDLAGILYLEYRNISDLKEKLVAFLKANL
jgi:CheY-like chemotaxis protein